MIWDIFLIGVFLFVLFIAMPPIMNLGVVVTQHVVAQQGLNATQISTLNHMSTNFFLNTPDIIMAIIYFVLIIAAFISASYEGANAAVTLVLGLFFIVISLGISFWLSDFAHAYITQAQFINTSAHLSITIYIMNYLPYFNGLLTIAYIIFVVMRREQIVGYAGGGGGGQVITT